MSTKTAIKRVALVAAVALTLGGFSAVSASAQSAAQSYIYCSKADGGTISNTSSTGATCNGVAGPVNTVTLTGVQTTKDMYLTVTGSTFNASTNWTLNAAGTTASVAATSAGGTITVNTPAVGTITVNVYTAAAGTGLYTLSTETVVITVAASAASGVYSAANSTAYVAAGAVNTIAADATSAIVKQKTYTATDSATASIIVNYLDANGTGKPIFDTLTATISSGPGALAKQSSTTVATAGKGFVYDSTTVAVGAANTYNVLVNSSTSVGNYSTSVATDAYGYAGFFVFANGQAGVSTITIKNSAGVVIATKTVTFTGTDVSSITLTAAKAFVNGDTAGGATSGVITAVLKDSAGNVVSGLAWTPTVTYSSALLGAYRTNGGAGVDTTTSTSTGTVTYGWTAPSTVAYGPVTVTFKDPTTAASASVVITVSSAKAATFTVKTADSVNAGDNITYTATAKDANGYAVPDGTLVSNYIKSATTTAGTGAADWTGVKFAAGTAALTTTGPIVATSSSTTTFTLTGTAATADSNFAAALAATTIPVTFAVNSADQSSSLAVDAANAATDAANAAAEEASNATEAASEALAAVNSLATTVASLIAGIKAQLTALTALVKKLQK